MPVLTFCPSYCRSFAASDAIKPQRRLLLMQACTASEHSALFRDMDCTQENVDGIML